MKFLTDILKTIFDGLFILVLVLAIAGFELSERPWHDPEQAWTPPVMSNYWEVPKAVRFKSAKYEWIKRHGRSK